LIVALERRIYSREDIPLILISRRIGEQLGEFYGRGANDPVVYLGLDHSVFNPERRLALRDRTRAELGIAKERFVLLLIGNDWRNKGFPAVMGALARVRDLPIDLLLVSSEDTAPVYEMAAAQNLRDRVRCLPPRSDVEQYYAAADMYTGPSLEDAFAQPPAEAMACGLPVIVSSTNGVSEIITDGVDGFIMRDAHDEDELASTIRRLWEHRELRAQIGHAASVVVQRYTWEQNAAQLLAIFQNVLLRKAHLQADTLTQEL
jgi:UDP-glucose:(heptosyl)LPS alpha-1,3-glucosyltransferase